MVTIPRRGVRLTTSSPIATCWTDSEDPRERPHIRFLLILNRLLAGPRHLLSVSNKRIAEYTSTEIPS
jgi:hypothetical protein